MPRVVANGKAYEVAERTSVAQFIRARDLDPAYVVVEHNGEALERSRYEDVTLRDGDRLELVRAVAGGAGAPPEPRPGTAELGMWRRERLAASRLYVVTDARAERGDLQAFLEEILAAGADIVQLREKEAEAGDLLRWGGVFRELTRRHGALFVVNDRPDVTVALEADGVHLGQNDLPAAFARGLVGPDVLVGLSTRDPEQLARAPVEATDYLCAGPLWETPTKPGRPAAGLDYVRHAAAHAPDPWFAIGGITAENVDRVVAAGARRVVVVRAVTEAADPGDAVRRLLETLPPLAAG